MNQVLYCSLGSGDYELVESFVEKYCSSSFPSKYFDYKGEEIRIYPMADVVSWLPTSLPIFWL